MYRQLLAILKRITKSGGVFILLALPASGNYQLNGYGFDSGGVSDGASNNYKAQGITGELNGTSETGTTYNVKPGLLGTEQTATPAAPTLSNLSNYYNKLQLVIATGTNPTDATYAIAISSDGFVTTSYVQNDNTVGSVLGSEDYQTYAQWGSSSGFYIIGLTQNTTYQVKVKASRGRYTESPYSAVATSATIAPSLTFDIDVASTDIDTSPPYAVSFGNLLPGTVTTATNRIWVDFDTNGLQGGAVYLSGLRGGLFSAAENYTVATGSVDLTAATEGFGVQVASNTQASGGPFNADSPYNGSSNNVGIANSVVRQVFDSSGQITAGRGSFNLKAKTSSVTPAAGDYTETFTVIASAQF